MLNKKPIYYLYLHRFFNEFADSLIKVFIPVVVYAKTGDLFWVLCYLAGYYIIQSAINATLGKRICKYPVFSIMFRFIPLMVLQAVLVSDMFSLYFVVALSLSTALSNALYWVPVNNIFALLADEHLGKRAGEIRAVSRFGNLLAPMISGFAISRFGVESVAILAVANYIISLLVLFPSRGVLKCSSVKGVETVRTDKKQPGNSLGIFLLSYVLVGIFDTSEIFWSLYIYSVSTAFVKVGISATLIKAGVMAANLITGKIADKEKWFIPAITAVLLFAVLWCGRFFAENTVSLYLLSVTSGFLCPFFLIPVFSKFIYYAKLGDKLASWLIWREVSIKAGGCLVVALAAILPTFFAGPFFLSAGAAVILGGIMAKMYSSDKLK